MKKEETLICKGIAIIMMYIHHLFYPIDWYQEYPLNLIIFNEYQITQIAYLCKICVAIFVFLTGYGYTKSQKSKQLSYEVSVCKRLVRLLTGFWIVFILALISGTFLGRSPFDVYGKTIPFTIFYLILDGLGLANIMKTPTFNGTWWYMSYAILLVFITPYIIKWVKKAPGTSLVISLIFPRFLTSDIFISPFYWYSFTLVLGITCAEFNLFERMNTYFKSKKHVDIILILIVGYYLAKVRDGFFDGVDGLLAAFVCYTVYCLISKIPLLNKTLMFLGKHSMNLFFIHTFIYFYYFRKFIFSFQYPIAVLCLLLLTTIVLSIFIEKLKDIIQYAKFEKFSYEKLLKVLNYIKQN